MKVADFGIARALTEAQVTVPGVTMGSVHYFSPEQARGETATAAVRRLRAGHRAATSSSPAQRPFTGDGAGAIALARLSTPPTWPSTLSAGVPPELDAIVQRAMALDPQQRYASAAAMGAALEGWLERSRPRRVAGAGGAAAAAAGVVAGAAVAGAAATGAARTVASAGEAPRPVPGRRLRGLGPARPRSAPAARRRRPPPVDGEEEPDDSSPWAWIAGLIGLLILIVVGFLVFQMLTGGRGEEPSAGPSARVGVRRHVELPSFMDLTFEEAEDAGRAARAWC